jgi:uncharacterized SAM-binding protein YcdF (DUF218 family)
MQTQIRELPGSAVAAGLAVLGGVAVWQFGIELERAWLRSDDGPLPGDAVAGIRDEEHGPAQIDRSIPASGERRRWVARHHHRAVPGAARVAWRA